MAVEIYRLTPEDAASWQLYPSFEARVRAFLKEFSPDFDAARVNRFVNETRQRWINTPQLAGYCIVMSGGTPLERKAVGHILSWVQDFYGKPYVMLFQLANDRPDETRDVLRKAMVLLKEWVEALNKPLREQKYAEIDYLEHWTIRDPEALKQLLPELQHEKQWTVMRIRL